MLVVDTYVSSSALLLMPERPLSFEFNGFRSVSLVEQLSNAYQYNEVLIV